MLAFLLKTCLMRCVVRVGITISSQCMCGIAVQLSCRGVPFNGKARLFLRPCAYMPQWYAASMQVTPVSNADSDMLLLLLARCFTASKVLQLNSKCRSDLRSLISRWPHIYMQQLTVHLHHGFIHGIVCRFSKTKGGWFTLFGVCSAFGSCFPQFGPSSTTVVASVPTAAASSGVQAFIKCVLLCNMFDGGWLMISSYYCWCFLVGDELGMCATQDDDGLLHNALFMYDC